MNTKYEFINNGSALATQVFVGNDLARQAVSNCDRSAANGAGFSYRPWQFLNASAGARESFDFGSGLSIVARAASTDAGLAPSKPTPVLADHLYLVFPGTTALCVTDLGNGEAGSTQVTAIALGIAAFALAIDWYLDDTRIGTSEPVGSRQSARFKNDGTLLFRAVDPENPPPQLSPKELDDATAYQASSYVRKVLVTLNTGADGRPAFRFTPP
jgi:hypothetical protein